MFKDLLADVLGQLALLPVVSDKDAAIHGKVRFEDAVPRDGRARGEGEAEDVGPDGRGQADVLDGQLSLD